MAARPSSFSSRLFAGLGLLVALVIGVPFALLSHARSRTRACLASISAPRSAELPDCRQEIGWYVAPSRVPWTANVARRNAEELSTRMAIARYDDAAIGWPSASGLERAGDPLIAAGNVMRAGSQRVTLDELGAAVGAPDLGRSAMLMGDRRTLIARAGAWESWPARLRTIEAALLDGDAIEAAAIARSYLAFDPRDDELSVAVAAIVCMRLGSRDGSNEDAQRALDRMGAIQAERAHDKHEYWVRNWGDVRTVAVACAAKAKKEAPAPPDRAEGGADDHVEARAVLRLRLAAAAGGDGAALRTAAYEAIQMLKAGPLPPGVRVRLLAGLLASDYGIEPELVASLATPRVADGEGPILPAAHSFTALDWLDEPRGVRVSPSRQALRHATDRLERMATSTEIAAEDRLALHTAAAATALEAARAFALAGDGAGAVEVLERAGARAVPSAAARALARSSAFYVAGDRSRALAEIDHEPKDLADDPALGVAWWIQTAELCASLGRRDEASRAAVLADTSAQIVGDRSLEVRALWTRLAFARPPLDGLRAAPPPPLPGPRAWPWTGEIATAGSWLTPAAESPTALARALGAWDAARRASPDERRAIRYAAMARHRGDAPRSLVPYLVLAADLVPAGEGETEVWLDAFSSTVARRVTMRAFAWSRAEAARARGDGAAATRWEASYAALVKMAAAPEDAELAAALGI